MATYYARADGSAANKEAATDPSAASTSLSLSGVMGESFSGDDEVAFSSQGGEYRGTTLWIPSSGTSGHNVIYRNVTGETPVFKGSQLVTGFTNYSGNIWQATVTTEPECIWVDDTFGNRTAGTGGMAAEYDWYWASNVLYLYAATDPDARYSEVEAAYLSPVIAVSDTHYVTLRGLTISHSNETNLALWIPSHVIVEDCTIEWAWGDGIVANSNDDYSDVIIRDNVVRYCGTVGISVLINVANGLMSDIYVQRNEVYESSENQCNGLGPGDNGVWSYYHSWSGGIKFWGNNTYGAGENCVIDENYVYDCGGVAGVGIWMDFVYNAGTGDRNIISNNLVANNNSNGIFLEISSFNDVFGNIIYGCGNVSGDWGGDAITLHSRPEGANRICSGNHIYNNTIIGVNRCISAWVTQTGTDCRMDDNIVKNNIFVQGADNVLMIYRGPDNDGTNGSGNVYERNMCAEGTNFMEWGGSRTNYSTWDAWLAASSQTDNNVEEDAVFVDADNDNYEPHSTCASIGAGENLGSPYDIRPLPGSTWPDGVLTGDQDSY